ncbi:MAG: hypothetical protein K0R84_1600 [Clostridia bacterium]|jgi:fluoroquinolone transport system permease protein|nr:hypothetical protein [Clostridia bacterium]
MRALISSFTQFWRQISKDSMLLVVCVSPILAGLAFRFGIPEAEKLLTSYFGKSAVLAPYYLLFDIFLGILTPYMFCFASAMVILEDIDSSLTNYLSVTPIGKSGYLLSRLVFPGAISALLSFVILTIFTLTNISVLQNILLSFFTACIGVLISLLIVALSGNKVEGMAIAKLGGLFLLGVPIPFFITGAERYYAAVLPSFWVSSFMLAPSIWNAIGIVVTIICWSGILYRWFKKKIA